MSSETLKIPIRYFDIFTIVLLFIFAALSLSVYQLEIRGFLEKSGTPVASLQSKKGYVKRLAHGQVSWDFAETGTPFSKRDTLATSSDSYATLEFADGLRLEIDPDSMVMIDDKAENLELSFIYGNAKVVALPTQTKTLKKRSITITKGQIKVSANGGLEKPKSQTLEPVLNKRTTLGEEDSIALKKPNLSETPITFVQTEIKALDSIPKTGERSLSAIEETQTPLTPPPLSPLPPPGLVKNPEKIIARKPASVVTEPTEKLDNDFEILPIQVKKIKRIKRKR
jgi:hypothetical protein